MKSVSVDKDTLCAVIDVLLMRRDDADDIVTRQILAAAVQFGIEGSDPNDGHRCNIFDQLHGGNSNHRCW
jgi:hypothetical protein